MANLDSQIETGGRDGDFHTTHWSVVLQAGMNETSHSAAALEALCRRYWPPIYYFARRRGQTEADAKDLTQHFFHKLMERNDFSGLDPRKGKFRTFLLAAFTHFLANEHDHAHAQKRGGGKIIVSLDELPPETAGLSDPHAELPAAKLFDRQWAGLMVKAGLADLKNELGASGKATQFEVLKAFLAAEPSPGEYTAAAQQLNLAPASVPVLVHRLRQRFRQLVRAQVAQTVASPGELDEEMRHLFEVLNQ